MIMFPTMNGHFATMHIAAFSCHLSSAARYAMDG